MKTSIKMFLLVGVICIVSSITGCSREMPSGIGGNSGGSTSDVDGIVCGVLYEPDGLEPAKGASVILRPRDFLYAIQTLSKRGSADSIHILSTITDNKGIYTFRQVPEGMYCIEGRDGINNCVFIDSVKVVKDSSRQSLKDTLRPPAVLHGKIPPRDDSVKVVIQIFGLDKSAEVNPDGTWSIGDVPEGTMRMQFTIVRSDTISFDTVEVAANSGDTIDTDTLVTSPEIVTMPDTVIIVNVGGVCSLQVTADGKPEPSYQWFKDSNFLYSGTGGILTIPNVTMDDNGTYRCRAVNIWGEARSLPIRLDVRQFDVYLMSGDNTLAAVSEPGIGGTITASKNTDSEISSITAHTAEGYRFDGWTGDTAGINRSDTTIHVSMEKNLLLKAHFIKQCKLTLSDSGNGTVHPAGIMFVDSGVPTPIAAVVNSGFELRAWRVVSGKAIIEDSTAVNTSVRLENDARIVGIFTLQTFKKTFGGPGDDWGAGVHQTNDGGFIITGSTGSYAPGDSNVHIIKIDANGNEQWTRHFDDINTGEWGCSVRQTTDGGYIIIGTTFYMNGNTDAMLIKTDGSGNEIWSRTYDRSDSTSDYGYSVLQTNDGGYILSGRISPTEDSDSNAYVLKTDEEGNEQWRTLAFDRWGLTVAQTSDGGYIVGRYFYPGGPAGEISKIDATGKVSWNTQIENYTNIINYTQQTDDGGYMVIGESHGRHTSPGVSHLVKTDAQGNVVWAKTYPGDIDSCLLHFTGRQTSDGGYIMIGTAEGKENDSLQSELYLIKADADGKQEWIKTFGGPGYQSGNSVQQTSDGGYVIIGRTRPSDAEDYDIWIIKTDENGEVK